jgi:D-psicose/D-tagatose/L-ribulose 3-epimerase
MQPSPRFCPPLGVSDFSTTEPLQNAELIIRSGMEFIEPGLAKIASMPEDDFELAAQRLAAGRISVLSMNWFLPPALKITGPDVDDAASCAFLSSSLGRAQRLGTTAVVFGSPGSRSVPAGFSTAVAKEQMIRFCLLCADVIRDHGFGMKIAVEPVNHTETNFINTFAEALEIVQAVDRPEIGLAADLYHLVMEKESIDILLQAPGCVYAAQLADPAGRKFPKPGSKVETTSRFFEHLAAIGYTGGISVEANVGADLATDCRDAFAFLSNVRSLHN